MYAIPCALSDFVMLGSMTKSLKAQDIDPKEIASSVLSIAPTYLIRKLRHPLYMTCTSWLFLRVEGSLGASK